MTQSILLFHTAACGGRVDARPVTAVGCRMFSLGGREGRECDCVSRGTSGNDIDWQEDRWSVGTESAPCAGSGELT